MIIDKFLLMSGEDIPLTTSNIVIHHPTLQELVNVFLYEDNFLTGFEFLFFSKDKLNEEEQIILQSLSDFEILLALLSQSEKSPMKIQLNFLKQFLFTFLTDDDEASLNSFISNKNFLKQFLSLLFNQYEIKYNEEHIVLNKGKYTYIIDEQLFDDLKIIINQMFPFHRGNKQVDFNPSSKRAKEIADKIKKGREKVAKNKAKKEGAESLFDKYISILSVGLQIPIKQLYKNTTYQLFNMFERYEKKITYDVHLKAQLAGATGMKDVDHWMM